MGLPFCKFWLLKKKKKGGMGRGGWMLQFKRKRSKKWIYESRFNDNAWGKNNAWIGLAVTAIQVVMWIHGLIYAMCEIMCLKYIYIYVFVLWFFCLCFEICSQWALLSVQITPVPSCHDIASIHFHCYEMCMVTQKRGKIEQTYDTWVQHGCYLWWVLAWWQLFW